MLSWVTKNWFLAGLLIATGLGFLFPDQGATGGLLRTELTTKLAVAGLFFIRGTLLPLQELRRGIFEWRLHAWTHAYIFLFFPLGVLLLFEAAGFFAEIDPEIRLGYLFLAVLPTTVSTAAVFTALAGGNTAGAVFNATSSNCLGVLIAPLWLAWFLQREAVALPLDSVIFQVVLLVLVPLFLGQMVKPFLWEFEARHRKALEILSSLLILFVMFAAFANSVVAGTWQEHGWGTLLGVFVASLFLFILATLGAWWGSAVLRMSTADRICFLFCAPQKTLASAVTIANVVFPGDPALTLILLPSLFYHFIQLFLGGFMVSRVGSREEQ